MEDVAGVGDGFFQGLIDEVAIFDYALSDEQIDHAEREKNRAEIAIANLTDREREVMCLVVEGNTNKVVAAQLGISEKTVEVHRSRVMEKTGASSLSDLVRICLMLKEKL